jgi:hypothetical protein
MVTMAVPRGRHADDLGEARTERAQRRAADSHAGVGDRLPLAQKSLRSLDASRHEIGVGSLAVRRTELAREVCGRHECGTRHCRDIEGLRVVTVYPVTRPAQLHEVGYLRRHSDDGTRPVAPRSKNTGQGVPKRFLETFSRGFRLSYPSSSGFLAVPRGSAKGRRSDSRARVSSGRPTRATTTSVRVPSGHEALYRGPVSSPRLPGGVVHKLPGDLRRALITNPAAFDAWKDITPLARNEFICWVEDAKQEMTRERRIRRTQEELEEGQRRPCCWPGCKHRERTGR